MPLHTSYYGPTDPVSEFEHSSKYRIPGETFLDVCNRLSGSLSDSEAHRRAFRMALLHMKFLPAGRIQRAVGSPLSVTPYNCFVSGTISDDSVDIMDKAKEAFLTMRTGGGIGYDFSTIRPRGAMISSFQSEASGAVSFMGIYDATCKTVRSAGGRRGAQMGVLRVDHPDIEEFIAAKQNDTNLTSFNVSVAVTDAFMSAVEEGGKFQLVHNGRPHKSVDARNLWNALMRATWDWAEPGVLFIDAINRWNNLWYCEQIAATNPSMPAGTLVHTDRGIVPIESIEGERFTVKSLNGQWAEAKCFLSSDSADVLEIDFGSGRTVRATPEHKWPVLLNGRYVKVLTSELKPGDLIPANRNEPLGHSLRQDLTREDGLIAGMAFGNGSYNIRRDDGRAYLSICFNNRDTDLQKLASDYFSVEPSVQADETVVNVSCDDVVLAFVEKVGLAFGDKSKLPATVWQSNDAFVSGFVDGLMSTDGCVALSNKVVVFTNKSRAVAREVALLLAFHGVLSTVRESSTTLNGKRYGRTDVKLSHNSAKRFASVFTLSSARKQALLDRLVAEESRSSLASSHLEVKSIRKVSTEKVWDITVYHDQHVFPTEWCYTGNCAEQPLPPYGACLLGSFNLTQYIREGKKRSFDFEDFRADIPGVVRAMDNVVDYAMYPLPQQQVEAKAKRRMGIGVTGAANAIEALGAPYGSSDYIEMQSDILKTLLCETYRASIQLAKEKGSFPLFDRDKFLAGKFVKTLPDDIQQGIYTHGIRNSHLTSIAPTGTISLSADNISSGIEPVYAYSQARTIVNEDGITSREVLLQDYGVQRFGVKGRTADDLEVEEHVDVLCAAQQFVDSAISKTCNVSESVTFERFKDIYIRAYKGGAKGCTTFRASGKRFGIIRKAEQTDEAIACTFDPATGTRSCS